MCLELIDIVRIVTNLLWGMKFTFYMNVQSEIIWELNTCILPILEWNRMYSIL